MNTIKLSVKQLVEFSCRSGDLFSSSQSGPSALEGIRAHQKIQARLADTFQAEFSVATSFRSDDIELLIGGRVDLVSVDASPPLLAEIKSCYGHPSQLPPGQCEQHWAQLKLYAYCYLQQHPEESIHLRMIWADLEQDQQHEETVSLTADAVDAFGLAALQRYADWQRLVSHIDKEGLASATAANFPHDTFRQGQRAMATAVFRSLRDSDHLLCEAPTGIGKTVSALFPAVKALGAGHIDKVVYLTAKNSGRQMARDAFASMATSGLGLSCLSLQAKNSACPCLNGTVDVDAKGQCPLSQGFFDRLPAAREQLLRRRIMHSEIVAEVAAEHRLCPFELALQMLPWCRLLICDYNYVFDPLVGLSYFKETPDRMGLLVDEAHNLVDRSRQMFSARLSRKQGQLAVSGCKNTRPQLSKAMSTITRALDRHRRQMDGPEVVARETPITVDRAVQRLLDFMARPSDEGFGSRELYSEWLKAVFRYRHIAELFGPHHRTIARSSAQKNGDMELKLQCLNASEDLAERYARFHGVVVFSATLRPQNFYHTALGLSEQCNKLSLPSPFPGHNQGSFIASHIDTRYQYRQQSIAPLAHLIHSVCSAKAGNYLVFFPSYAYMQAVAAHMVQVYPDQALAIQQQDADETQRAAFLQQFKQSEQMLGLAIMGGIYGEGVDYEGDKLIGAIVIGVGLPGMDTEQNLIRSDFDAAGLNGFDFAYRYPGLGRVLQAAGRVIRSESDQGVVILVDPRFRQQRYRQLLPDHWQVRDCNSLTQLESGLQLFWHDTKH